ncbi:hypothetical protein BCR39DRAFT_531080 [Naematelia encephala]|uniref:C2H2-type domain-containing protein n=1 Tax=Naematelia encephala TaxID=71784 RepID=A0A1Y2B5H6_9TREE|nr:hypothetical protein BCR39DRAFT_531080 [Naematelia encephala]
MTTMTYPSLPNNAYLQPSPNLLYSSQGRTASNFSSSGSPPPSIGPITPELPSLPTTASDYLHIAREQDQRRESTSTAANDDNIQCKWKDCKHRAIGPEELYEHFTNNLCLICGWEGCGVKCVKRDHITSHLRGDTYTTQTSPCAVCGKTFKRPQDLKKHERIHTQEHHQLHKLSKAATTSDPHFNERVATQPIISDVHRRSSINERPRSPLSLSPSSSSGQSNLNPSSPYDHLVPPPAHPAHKSVSPTPSALAMLHRKQHEELAAYQQREMMVLQQLAYQQQQSQAYAAQLASDALVGSKPGQKRDLDGGDSFEAFMADMKKRKVEPVYDADMVNRLNALTVPPMPNSFLQPIPTVTWPNTFVSLPFEGTGNPNAQPDSQQASSQQSQLPGLPEIRNEADLAMFNHFMLSLGRDAAAGGAHHPQPPVYPMAHTSSMHSGNGSRSSSSPLSDQSPIEDLFNSEELASLGLTGMPGIPDAQGHHHAQSSVPNAVSFGNMYPSLDGLNSTRPRGASMPDADVGKRAIAGLPRAGSLANNAVSSKYSLSNIYGLGPTPYAELAPFDPSQSIEFTHNGLGNPEHNYATFESLARSKATVPAPSLAPRDYSRKVYRHVTPLGASVSSRSNVSDERTHMETDEPDEIDYEATPKISVRSLLLSDEDADPAFKLPAIHSPGDEDDRTPLPSITELQPTASSSRASTPTAHLPVKRHTEDEILRGVKRLELADRHASPVPEPSIIESRRPTSRAGPNDVPREMRRRHAAMIRAWIVAVNLQWKRKQLEEMEMTQEREDVVENVKIEA